MRVGFLTSWRVPCGVYQYTSRLADAMAKRSDAEVVILAGRADEHRSVPEESDHPVYDVATIGYWRDDGRHDLDAARILGVDEPGAWPGLDLDVIHVQYQSILFTEPHLTGLMGRFRGVRAVTFHDNCVLGSFPTSLFDLRFTHRPGVGLGAEPLSFGIEDRPPIIRSFGLGRTRADLIAAMCQRNDWTYEDASLHEPIHGGDYGGWRTHAALIDWLRGADAIVLWYDDNPAAGSSQAARTAMATRRPVFVNDTTWFSDLPARADGFWKVSSERELETHLQAALARPYVSENSWGRVAAHLVDRYDSVRRSKAVAA